MRLIDANALKIHRMHNAGANHPLDIAYRKDIDNAPTVVATPVVHGRWIQGESVPDKDGGGNIYHCSECGDWYHNFVPNYCPNCGAKMDGDRNG